ncbi:NAD(P)-dependent oxidoreductase [Nonomuraea gerenzanensis]|uniref:D-3-phosphoglycerate dehydrogenase n=1 Tax=Nonomuraea gerenzanensis TaxID=93944 RepID=A0A1M4E5H7_9ACTN|nr:NAD(P)-dependent oxidoreductase [Nonomuraea gerenzanensis]UBU16271.1 hypothetical protein LCN96_15020 [Nonomuraea gerenzanensis]SBO94086.1 D-3-phosphoglycerate dehydrogenase [Nonomuraea gerenzanensis]
MRRRQGSPGVLPGIDARIIDVAPRRRRAHPGRRARLQPRPPYAGGHDRALWQPGDGTGLHDCTVGGIGASRIGRLVLQRLLAFDVRVLLSDPTLTPAEAALLGAEAVEPDELCRRSDPVTVHAPALPETHHLLDRRRLALLPDRAVLVNTARGSLVDTGALTGECVSGRLSAVLDVTDPEPLPAGHPLFELPNVLITPHLPYTA